VRWFFVDRPLRRAESIDEQITAEQLARAMLKAQQQTDQLVLKAGEDEARKAESVP
jgi:hypothetical protein